MRRPELTEDDRLAEALYEWDAIHDPRYRLGRYIDLADESREAYRKQARFLLARAALGRDE